MSLIQKAKEDIFLKRKFGIFVHWGLYSLLGGVWKGEKTPYIGEWIMKRCRIPVKEYEQLAAEFNPEDFDPDLWIDIVARAGARYFVFTAKHHDGFAMYHSKSDKFNIIDASGFKYDPVEELARACAKRDIKFCLYYSQDQDWHHEHGTGNDWDYVESEKDFAIYFERKVKPQVTELLTQYGPIGLIWFDTPVQISRQHSQELFDLVHRLQPACLVNGRLGHGIGDYAQTEDNDLPAGVSNDYWEIPATMNDTWGFKQHDNNWKSSKILIRHFIEAVSKGGNYLLNLGPDARGVIPTESIKRIEAVGEWLKVNREAVFCVEPSPFLENFPWGNITVKPRKLFLNVTNPPGDIIYITGLRNKVDGMHVIGRPETNLSFEQKHNTQTNTDILDIRIPASLKDIDSYVIVLEVQDQFDVDNTICQQPDGKITLEAYRGNINTKSEKSTLKLGQLSSMYGWLNTDDWMSWSFKLNLPGNYLIKVVTAGHRKDGDPATPVQWEGQHEVEFSIGDKKIRGKITQDAVNQIEGSYARYIVTNLGRVYFDKPGQYDLKLKPEKINSEKGLGFILRSVTLTPIKQAYNIKPLIEKKTRKTAPGTINDLTGIS